MQRNQHNHPSQEAEHTVARWRSWIKRIVDDVVHARSDQRSWEEVNAMWRRNRSLRVPGDARRWIARMHADSAALAVREQLDRHRSSISLWRLLDDLERRARYMTLDAHLSGAERGDVRRILADDAEEWMEPGTRHLDPAIAAEDRTLLEAKGKLARQWANREAAHADERGVRDRVTYGDLAAALTTVERLARKYALIVTCVGYLEEDGLLPHRQFDESVVFRRAWHKATWTPSPWSDGWIERTGDLIPSIDMLQPERYVLLARARHRIIDRLARDWVRDKPEESPIRRVLEMLDLPSSDAAVLWVRDRLLQQGHMWNSSVST